MKKRIVRITAALCAAALLAGCGGSIGSKDGGYYTTEAAAQESYANYDSVAGSVDSGLVPENAAEAATDETHRRSSTTPVFRWSPPTLTRPARP